MMIFKHELAL